MTVHGYDMVDGALHLQLYMPEAMPGRWTNTHQHTADQLTGIGREGLAVPMPSARNETECTMARLWLNLPHHTLDSSVEVRGRLNASNDDGLYSCTTELRVTCRSRIPHSEGVPQLSLNGGTSAYIVTSPHNAPHFPQRFTAYHDLSATLTFTSQ